MQVALSLCHCGVHLADCAVSFPCLSGVGVERDGRGSGAVGLQVREQQGIHTVDANANVTGVETHQSLPHLPIVFPWKLTKPHCVLGLLISVL